MAVRENAYPFVPVTMSDANAIFISYRRSDSNDVAGRIYDRLVARFGPETIFKDVHSIPYGVDFPTYIHQELAKCQVLLAVIGPTWLTVERDGQRRLENPADWVRVEIQTALENPQVTVIPLLVGHTRLPAKTELPDGLRALASLNSAQARPDPDFHQDMTRLIRQLEIMVSNGPTKPAPVMAEEPLSLAKTLELEDLRQQLAMLKQQYQACADEARLTGDPDRKVVLTEKVKRFLQQISDIDDRIQAIQSCPQG